MKKTLYASSGTREGITKCISDFFFTSPDRIILTEFPMNEWFISIDNWKNSGLPKKLEDVKVRASKKRYRFEER